MGPARAPLRLHVPEPSGRPGHETDFSYLKVAPPGSVRRPEIDVAPVEPANLGPMPAIPTMRMPAAVRSP